MKQTAVEWLLNEFQEAHKDFGGLDLQWLNKFEQAKDIEMTQITEAYWDGGQDIPLTEERCNQYYNETFKNK